MKNILVTGGAGFIGSNFIHYIFQNTSFGGKIINVDKLTYAGNLENLTEIDKNYGGERYFFEKVDICNFNKIKRIFKEYNIDTVVNFAAESHVDKSIYGPKDFVQTNIIGTFTLLEVARENWEGSESVLFHHISTDEVYGSIEEGGYFYEDTAYKPNSPYSASKASSDHLVRAYNKTYGLPTTISNCSNNYGSHQFPEKLIPLMILIIFVKDRPGHDRRYAINCNKIKRELGWERQFDFEEGLDTTIKWYINHQDWIDRIRSGEYRKWLEKNYEMR